MRKVVIGSLAGALKTSAVKKLAREIECHLAWHTWRFRSNARQTESPRAKANRSANYSTLVYVIVDYPRSSTMITPTRHFVDVAAEKRGCATPQQPPPVQPSELAPPQRPNWLLRHRSLISSRRRRRLAARRSPSPHVQGARVSRRCLRTDASKVLRGIGALNSALLFAL
jgi:hypothetical protein